jgi:death on curing protein
MAKISGNLIFPTFHQLIEINTDLIQQYGGYHNGNDNLRDERSLKWVLEAIQYPLFGEDFYPTIVEKTGILSWTINIGHVFFDGNKRTSTFVLLLFLHINDYSLQSSIDGLFEITTLIANHDQTGYKFNDYILWLHPRVIKNIQ